MKIAMRREPNGRAQRERQHSPTEIKRLRDAAMRGLRDEEWGTELGRLFLNGSIGPGMYGAGRRWRIDAAAYRKYTTDFPVRSAKLERGIRGHDPDPESEEGRKLIRKELDDAEAFMGAHSALVAAGEGAESAVIRLCEKDEAMVGLADLNSAKCGLSALAAYYLLTNR